MATAQSPSTPESPSTSESFSSSESLSTSESPSTPQFLSTSQSPSRTQFLSTAPFFSAAQFLSTAQFPSTPQFLSRPQSQPPLNAPAVTPSPGSWRHPRADEIARRQRANTFNESNIRKIAYNGAALAILLYAFFHIIVSLYNIVTAALPLFRTADDLTDVPLTPTQRALLGLDPTVTPPVTPGTKYITPPRYPRSSTPRSVSGTPRSVRGSSGMPLSRKASPLAGATDRGDSPTASPLWQKSRDVARRGSYGSPGPLGVGVGGAGDKSFLRRQPATPSPTGGIAGRNATVGLNSKWLYEKGKMGTGMF
ncbi:MAG: hypothetical protein Q9163_005879 [Psora crenata]